MRVRCSDLLYEASSGTGAARNPGILLDERAGVFLALLHEMC